MTIEIGAVGGSTTNNAPKSTPLETPRTICSARFSLLVLNPGIPRVPLVFPVAALTTTDRREALDEFDAHDVFRHFVTELTLVAQTKRRAIRDRQHLIIHLISEDG